MRMRMNQKALKILPVCILILALALGGCGKAPAAPQDKALQAYREILKAAPAIAGEHPELLDATFTDVQNKEKFGEHYDQFALADLNRDGTPELIASTVINFRWIPISVFTYADGKAVLLKDPAEEAVHGTFEQSSVANGAYENYICEENHFHSVWRGATPVGEMEENRAYALNGTVLTAVDCVGSTGEKNVSFADIAKTNTAENVAEMK